MVDYTRQRQWIDGQGIWLWFAFVLGGLGCGLFLVSLYLGNWTGMALGWFIGAILKGLSHLLFLGRPGRVWRALSHPQSSWITRGLFFVIGFGILGGVLVVPGLSTGLPWGMDSAGLKIAAGVFAFLVMMYPGFTMSYVNALAFWNNGILPLIYLSYGFLGGFGLSVPLALIQGREAALPFLEDGLRWLLLTSALVLAIYFTSATYAGPAGITSVFSLLKGENSRPFYLGVLVLGIIIPVLASVVAGLVGRASLAMAETGMVSELIGSFAVRYCLLKAGFYAPLINSNFSHKA